MDQYQQWKERHRKDRHKDELILVDGSVFFGSAEKIGIQFVTKQLEEICNRQQRKKDPDIGHERQFRHRFRDVRRTKHHQAGRDGQDIEKEHQWGDPVFKHLALPLDQREMSLGKQCPEYQEQFSTEGDQHKGKEEQQDTENQCHPVIRPHHRIPLEMGYTKPLLRKHGSLYAENKV